MDPSPKIAGLCFFRYSARLFLALFLLASFCLESQAIDQNGNGLSDVWEAAHNGNLNPSHDTDGDGFSNLAESRAGSNPRDPRSRPHISRLQEGVNQTIAITWPTVAGKRQQILYSLDLQKWSPLGASIAGTGSEHTATFSPASTYTGDGVQQSRWNNYTSSSLDTLKTYANSNAPAPSLFQKLTRLEIPQSNPDASNYGQWIRGWLIAPQTGAYTFHIASDDHGEFWLSTDAIRANRQLRAFVSSFTNFREWNKFASQQSAPVTLQKDSAYYFEIFHREGGGGDHLSVGWSGTPVGSATPVIIEGGVLSSTGESLASQIAAGKLFFRVAVDDVDTDGDGATDYEEKLLGFNIANPTTRPRVNDRDAILGMLAARNTVTAGTSIARTYETGGTPAQFVIFRSGNIDPISVPYTLSGTALPGVDYHPLSGSIQFAAGQTRAELNLTAMANGIAEPVANVILNLESLSGYDLGNPRSATITIDDSPDVLFVANLRPPLGIRSSGAGTAAVNRAGNSLSSKLSVSFGNLRGTATGIDFYVSTDGTGGPVVLTLPAGQIAARNWDFTAAGGLTRGQILSALNEGRLWVRIRSSAEPTGEMIGQLVTGLGWQTMPTPLAAGTAPTSAATDGEAARFLAQATFGPRTADIAALRATTYAAWIDAQIAGPITRHLPAVEARRAELLARNNTDGWQGTRQNAWWQAALTAPDQLRQRMALALSEILVVSQFGPLDGDHVGTTLYYDMLLENAFGNYRDLLEDVTVSPMMGVYLSMMRNRKPNPVNGHEPDENYAREIMQLFSIGLKSLHPDGSLRLDANGLPIDTYTQDDVVALAHIFTGWGPHYDPANPPRWDNGNIANRSGWFQYGSDPLRPMSFYTDFHDYQPRTIVTGDTIPGTLTGEQRMARALDRLFQHPNTGPFLARQLIQRFVTANPSPGYIHRVSAAFANNGSGVRGDLAATLRAVLLDHEARNTTALGDAGYGKPMEPLLRMSRMFRLFFPNPPKPGDSRFFIILQYDMGEQAPLLSPSVFNFFQPGYTHPGRIAAAGLLSPEFQILAETTVVNQANLHHGIMGWGHWTSEPLNAGSNAVLRADFSEQVAILNTPGVTRAQAGDLLIEHLNIRLLGGRMSEGLKQSIRNFFTTLPSWYDYSTPNQQSRARVAAYLVFISPEFSTQR